MPLTGLTFQIWAETDLNPRVKLKLPIDGSPDSPNGLKRNFGESRNTSWVSHISKIKSPNALNHEESQILRLYLKNSGNSENHQIEGLSTGLEGLDHQEKRHKILMCDSPYKSHKETPPKLP